MGCSKNVLESVMDILVKLVKDKTPGDEIRKWDDIKKLTNNEPYWLYLGKKPLHTKPEGRAYICYKSKIWGYLYYQGYEEKLSYEGNFKKWAFKFSGPYTPIKPFRIDRPGSWRWRYVERVAGLRKSLDNAAITDR